jgi:hypothetical protein
LFPLVVFYANMPLQCESAQEGEDDEVLIDADGNGGNEEE